MPSDDPRDFKIMNDGSLIGETISFNLFNLFNLRSFEMTDDDKLDELKQKIEETYLFFEKNILQNYSSKESNHFVLNTIFSIFSLLGFCIKELDSKR